jgi:hypothetical protein
VFMVTSGMRYPCGASFSVCACYGTTPHVFASVVGGTDRILDFARESPDLDALQMELEFKFRFHFKFVISERTKCTHIYVRTQYGRKLACHRRRLKEEPHTLGARAKKVGGFTA